MITKNQGGKNMKEKILIGIIGVLVGVILTSMSFYVYTKSQPREPMPEMMRPEGREMGEFGRGPKEEEMEKETKAENVDAGKIVTEENINLSEYDSNITITEAGNYTLTGEFEHAVLINSNGAVTLNLDNVTIKNSETAAIANISQNELTLNLLDDTTNTLSDGGSSEYDGCIYSMGALTITGNGNLEVFGNQEEGEGIATETNDITINGGTIKIESKDDGINAGGDGGVITINGGDIFIKASGDGIDSNKNLIINGGNIYTIGSPAGGDAGIDTEDGFVIQGGSVIALGSGMLEMPEASSKQKSVCFDLKTKVSEGTQISLRNEKEEEILSFETKEDCKTFIISDAKLEDGTYTLYQNGEKTDFSAKAK